MFGKNLNCNKLKSTLWNYDYYFSKGPNVEF